MEVGGFASAFTTPPVEFEHIHAPHLTEIYKTYQRYAAQYEV